MKFNIPSKNLHSTQYLHSFIHMEARKPHKLKGTKNRSHSFYLSFLFLYFLMSEISQKTTASFLILSRLSSQAIEDSHVFHEIS